MKSLRCVALTVTVLLASYSQSAMSSSPQQVTVLQGKRWVLLDIIDTVTDLYVETFVDGYKRPTLTFEADGFSIHDGCNAFGGSYTATATTLTIGEYGGADKGCSKEASARAKAYLNAFEGVSSYRLKDENIRSQNYKGQITTHRSENEHLELLDAEGRTTLAFTEANDRYRVTLQLKADTEVNLDDRANALGNTA